MKKYNISLIMLVLVIAFSCQEKIDIEKEKEAIKSVVREEIALFLAADYIPEANLWKTEDYVRMVRNFGNDRDQIVGWDNIRDLLKHDTEEFSKAGYTNAKGESRDFNIKVYDKLAWAVFYQDWSGELEGETIEGTQSRLYFLEKVDDNWKIVLMTMTNLNPCETEEESIKEVE
jgi:hypothetical protein